MQDKTNMINFFDNAASSWDEHNADTEGAKKIIQIDAIKSAIPGSKILDVGCGTGVMEPLLVDNGAVYVKAIDMSKKMIIVANSKYSYSNVDFCIEDVFNEADTYDLVIMFNVYPHLLNKEFLAKKISEIVKPYGRFVVAHGSGKDNINSHHKEHAHKISDTLRSASMESEYFSQVFNIDVLIDKKDIYCFSGTKFSFT